MIMIDERYLLHNLKRLVQIDSTNPSLAESGQGEREIARFVEGALRDLGLAVESWEVAPGRWNVLGKRPGKGHGRSLMWNAHLDTVGVAGMAEPFTAAVRQGRLYGRGSLDMKGSLAAMMAAVKALADADVPLAGDLLITAVADEEHGSIGSEDIVARGIRADAVIVTEPTNLTICRAHRGFIWFDVETFGRAAHGSRFREGIDANMHMGRFLVELDKLAQSLLARTPPPLVDVPSLHAAILSGGSEISVYADHCLLKLERRTVPGETVDQATAELQTICDTLHSLVPSFQARVTPTFSREPFTTAADSAIVQSVEASLTRQTDRTPAHTGQTFWSDAALFAAAGMDTMLLGPTGEGLHSAEEWVDVASVTRLAAVLADTAVHYCT